MPQPSQTDVHVDAILTNISIAYIQKAANFISQKVFPVVPVDKQSDKYFKYNKADWFRDEAELRADATESAGSGYTLATDFYYAPVYAFHKDVGDQVRANTDNPLDPDRDATQFVTQRMMLRQEIQWVSDYFKTGVWGTDVVGGTAFVQWNDYAGSDPIEDIELGKASHSLHHRLRPQHAGPRLLGVPQAEEPPRPGRPDQVHLVQRGDRTAPLQVFRSGSGVGGPCHQEHGQGRSDRGLRASPMPTTLGWATSTPPLASSSPPPGTCSPGRACRTDSAPTSASRGSVCSTSGLTASKRRSRGPTRSWPPTWGTSSLSPSPPPSEPTGT